MTYIIAAHAKSLNVPLVTNNTKEFARVDNLILYKKYYSLKVAAATISRTCSDCIVIIKSTELSKESQKITNHSKIKDDKCDGLDND